MAPMWTEVKDGDSSVSVLSYFFSNVGFFGSDGILKKKKTPKDFLPKSEQDRGKKQNHMWQILPKSEPKNDYKGLQLWAYSSK